MALKVGKVKKSRMKDVFLTAKKNPGKRVDMTVVPRASEGGEDDIPIVGPDEVEAAEEAAERRLPPKGASRNEAIARKRDRMAKKAEGLKGRMVRIDEKKLAESDQRVEQIRALLREHRHRGILFVTNKRKDRRYHWARMDSRFINLRRSLGWEFVKGEDQESIEYKDSLTGLRKCGSLVLMSIPKWRYEEIMKAEKQERYEAQGYYDTNSVEGASAHLADIAEASGGKVRLVPFQEFSDFQSKAQRLQAKNIADRRLDRMVRRGKVPGVAIPGEA